MNQGKLQSLKANYQRRIVHLCIKALDENKFLPKITILHAMKDLVPSWNAVFCFNKINIKHANQQTAVTNADGPSKSLGEELKDFKKLDQSAVRDKLSAETFIGLDSEAVTYASYMSDANILTDVIPDSIGDQFDDVNEDLDFSTSLKRSSKSDTEEPLDKLQKLSLFSSYMNEIRPFTLKI